MKVHEFKMYTARVYKEDICTQESEGDLIPALNAFLCAHFKDKVCKLEVECTLKRRQRVEQWLSKLENYVANRYDVLNNYMRKHVPDYNIDVEDFCTWFFNKTKPVTNISTDGKTLTIVWSHDLLH